MDPKQHHTKIFDKILSHGHAVQAVSTDPPFAYTVGRTLKARPELLIVGLPAGTMCAVLNDACTLDDKTPLGANQTYADIIKDFNVLVVEVDPRAAQMGAALGQFGEVDALQLLWPDHNGRYPGDPDVSPAVAELQALHRKEA